MTVSLTCKRCKELIVAEDEDDLMAQVEAHARDHGGPWHPHPHPRAHPQPPPPRPRQTRGPPTGTLTHPPSRPLTHQARLS